MNVSPDTEHPIVRVAIRSVGQARLDATQNILDGSKPLFVKAHLFDLPSGSSQAKLFELFYEQLTVNQVNGRGPVCSPTGFLSGFHPARGSVSGHP